MKKEIAITLMLIVVTGAIALSWQISYQKGYSDGKEASYNSINTGATYVQFTTQELRVFESVKSRLTVYNTDPSFTGDRTLQWISMRNSTSHDYYQKSMEYLCFWSGQGANGEWEAVVSIYNSPNNSTDFIVEIARFTWHSLEITLDSNAIVNFPQITNDTTSLGYATFHVSV